MEVSANSAIVRLSFNRSLNQFQLPLERSFRLLHTLVPHHVLSKCRSPEDAGEIRSKRVFNSRLWSSVGLLLDISLSGSFMSSALLGASGTGRTTFVNTLCESEVLSHKVSDSPETAHVEEGIRIKPVNVGALHLLCHQTRFSWGLSRFLFRAGGGWRAHCPDNCGHSRIW